MNDSLVDPQNLIHKSILFERQPQKNFALKIPCYYGISTTLGIHRFHNICKWFCICLHDMTYIAMGIDVVV